MERRAKKAVAKTKAEAFDDMYENMESNEGMKSVQRIAKQTSRFTRHPVSKNGKG